MNLTKNIDENIALLNTHFGIEDSFDVIGKEILIGEKRAYMVMIDGFVKDFSIQFVTERLQKVDTFTFDMSTLLKDYIAYMQAEEFSNFDQMEKFVLSGAMALIVDGFDTGLLIDAREFPIRSSEEPDLEKVTRGPRDGFVETIVFNTALIRRRVRDPKLRFEMKSVGQRSKTDVAIAYIGDLVDSQYVEEIHRKIDAIQIESLTMAEKSLSELLIKRSLLNPLPQIRYTERPDVAAAHLMEGHVLIIVDTTPSVMILPTTIFHFTQHAEDYYHNPLVGTYLRWIRFAVMFFALFLTPAWLIATHHPEWLPDSLQFILPEDTGILPLLLQLLLLDFGVDILRLSSIHTPSSLTTSLGIIGGLILGDLAVNAGWLIPETVLYTAIVGISTFAMPSMEFSMAIRIFRLYLLILTGLFGIYGFIAGIILISILILTTKNCSRRNYSWPFIPFNGEAIKHLLFREPTPQMHKMKNWRNSK